MGIKRGRNAKVLEGSVRFGYSKGRKKYRAVSALNLDHRLFTAVITRRLEVILPDITDLDQTGFLKKRQTTDNIRCTLLEMQNIKTRTEAVILGMDVEKAFDCQVEFLI